MRKLEKTNKKKQLKAKSKGGKTVKERQIDSKILITETIRTLIAKKDGQNSSGYSRRRVRK